MSAGQAGSVRLCWEGIFNQKLTPSGPHLLPAMRQPPASEPPGSLGALAALQGFLWGFQALPPAACGSLTALCPQPPGSVRRMSSPARMATASGACGTVMVIMTAVTTAMSSVVSGGLVRQTGGWWMAGPWEESTAMTLALPEP